MKNNTENKKAYVPSFSWVTEEFAGDDFLSGRTPQVSTDSWEDENDE